MDSFEHLPVDELQENSADPFPFASLNGFVGGDLSRTPYLSPIGALLKLSRLNRFTRKDLFAAFGFRLIAREDPARVLAFSESRLRRFSGSIGVNAHDREGWRFADWLPVQCVGKEKTMVWRLRACLPCAREGFHTWLFQMPWVRKCPWHDTHLVEICPSCGQVLTHGFIDGHPLLHCHCGIDFFNRHVALQMDAHRNQTRDRTLAEHLDWARSRRGTHYVFLSQVAYQPSDAWIALLNLQKEAASTAVRICRRPVASLIVAASNAAQRELELIDAQLTAKPPSLMDIPVSWAKPMRSIADNIVRKISRGSKYIADARIHDVQDFMCTRLGTKHSDTLLLPLQASNTRAFLDTSSVPKTTFASVSELMSTTRDYWRDPHTAREVLRVTRMLFFRAYANGLKAIFGRYFAAPLECPRLLQRQCAASLLITQDCVGVSRIRVVWTQTLSTRSRAPPA